MGIVFTEQPFLVAIYTQYVYTPVNGEELIGRICAALIAYQTQRTELDQNPPPETGPESAETDPTEVAPEIEPPAEAAAPETSAEAPTTAATEASTRAAQPEETRKTPWYFIAFPLIIIAGAVGGILVFKKR